MEKMISPRTTFQRQVLDQLGSDICSGRYMPGQTLPRESELCERFALSRTVIREAVKSLAAKGMLVVQRKVGTLVLASSEWNLFDPDIIAWCSQASGINREMSRDIIELRLIIEPAAARLAALHASDEDRRVLRTAFRNMERAVADEGDYVAADLAFHSAIFASSGNQFVGQMKTTLSAILRQGFEIMSQKPDGPRQSLPIHEALCRSIEDGKPDAAGKAAFALLEQAAIDLQECLDREAAEASCDSAARPFR
jgi:DNA-binding FadR family transcriptional regulator